jgi:hypothetical protein
MTDITHDQTIFMASEETPCNQLRVAVQNLIFKALSLFVALERYFLALHVHMFLALPRYFVVPPHKDALKR